MKKPNTKKGGRPPKGQPKLVPELVAAALVESRGNQAMVATKFHVSRSSLCEFIQARPLLQTVLFDAREGMKDHAESALHRAIIGGEAWAVCFFLKTQAKDRGYIEKSLQEHSGSVSQTIIYLPQKDAAPGPET